MLRTGGMIHRGSRAPAGESNSNPAPQAAVGILIVVLWGLAGGLAQGLTEFSGPGITRQQTQSQLLSDFNRVVQGSAFRAFTHPKTGIILTVQLNRTEAAAQAVRLRTGSLKRRGFTFNEFTIPIGASPVSSFPVRLVLVYRRFTANLYSVVNYTFVSPIVGIKVYDAFNLSDTRPLPEIEFQSGFSNLTVSIPVTGTVPVGVAASCATFDSSGSIVLFQAEQSNVCSWGRLGDFALVVPGAPPPSAAPAPAPAPAETNNEATKRKRRKSKRWKAILGGVLGGLGALLLLGLLAVLIGRLVRRSRMSKMEQQSERGEMLQSSLIGSNRAPIAGASRTRPVLESDYAATA